MDLVPSFVGLLQPFAALMTAPTYANLITIVTGWVFAERRCVTGLIEAAGALDRKHFSVYHRFFATAKWSVDALGCTVLRLLRPWLDEGLILLALDDTLARKHGRKLFAAGMHHDPLLSSRGQAVMNYGHCWVVLGVLVRFPFSEQRVFCLPLLCALYLNRKSAAKHRLVYRSKPELAVALLHRLRRAFPHDPFHVVADSAYGGESVLGHLPRGCDLTSRLVLNARLHEAPAPHLPGTRGRPARRGPALPTPAQMLCGRARRVTLNLYGRRDQVRLCDVEARVYKVPDRRLRVVATEAMRGGRGRQVFYSTCHEASAEQVLTWSAMRWSIEVTFREAKGQLGFEEPQNWKRQAVRRTAPLALLLYSLVVLWFAQEGCRLYVAKRRPWYPQKQHASFADMLATLRQASRANHHFLMAVDRGCCATTTEPPVQGLDRAA